MNYNNLIAITLGTPGTEIINNDKAVMSVESLINAILGVFTIIAIIYFVIQTILAGYSFFSTKGDPKLMQIAREKITYNLLGLVIVVVAFGATAFVTTLLGITDIWNLNSAINNILNNN